MGWVECHMGEVSSPQSAPLCLATWNLKEYFPEVSRVMGELPSRTLVERSDRKFCQFGCSSRCHLSEKEEKGPVRKLTCDLDFRFPPKKMM